MSRAAATYSIVEQARGQGFSIKEINTIIFNGVTVILTTVI
jgi:hypothetical protein